MLGVGLDELKQREAHRRQRRMMMLVTASVAGMAITSTLAGAAWLARNEAERQRVRAEAEAETARQTTRFMVDLFKVSDPSEALGNTITAREILDKGAKRIDQELADQPAIQATLMDTMGTVYTSLGPVRLGDPAGAQGLRAAHEALGRRCTPRRRQQPQSPRRSADAQVGLRRGREAPARGADRFAGSCFGPASAEVAETLRCAGRSCCG